MESLGNTFILKPINLLSEKCRCCNGFSGGGQPLTGHVWQPLCWLTRAADREEREAVRTGLFLYSTLHFQGADNLDLSIQVIKASIWKCPAGRWNVGEINGCCSLYPATSSIIWWTAWNRLGCQVLIKIEMNWSAHNSLRQSNSVIFFFAGYNLIVSQGGQLTQGSFLSELTYHLPFTEKSLQLIYLSANFVRHWEMSLLQGAQLVLPAVPWLTFHAILFPFESCSRAIGKSPRS